jgi:hypothetical protein
MRASEFKSKNKHLNSDIYNIDVIKQEVKHNILFKIYKNT